MSDSRKPRRAQADRRAETRASLLASARALFLSEGYEATTTRAILDHANLSKGAMYHHFTSKQEIIEAIFEAEAEAALRRAKRDGTTPMAGLRASALAWLAEIRRPETAAIMLKIGPAALGVARTKEIDERHALGLLTDAFTAARAAGEINRTQPAVAARLLSALLTEAAALRRYEDRAEAERMIDRFLSGLD